MVNIGLINMPFSTVEYPSIALTQLKYVLKDNVTGNVESKIFYLNHDFAQSFGIGDYWLIANSLKATVAGLGDWIFRLAAFPDAPDNSDLYHARYVWQFDQQGLGPEVLNQKRKDIDGFLDEMIDRYRLDECFMIGLTSMFAQNMACFAMARKLKERNPDIVTVMGGANCETCMGAVIAKNVDAIDFVFSGPALKTFPQLVNHLICGEEERCHDIVGVFSRKKLAGVDRSSLDEIGQEHPIEEAVPLDYDDFLGSIDQKCPTSKEKVSLLFETSRGCWWGERSQCRFCGLNGTTMKYRALEPQKALKLFDALFKYIPRVSRFKAVDNIVPKEYLVEVFPYLRTPEGAEIFYEIKTNLQDQDLQTLAEARVTELQPGIEALATSTLKLMRKGTTALGNIRFLKSCLTSGIKARWNLLVGFPGEREDVYEKYCQVLPLLHHLPPPTGVYPVRFDRYSPYFVLARQYGLKLKPYDFYLMVYPFDEQDLNNLAYFFVDANHRASHNRKTAKWLKKLERHIACWQNRWSQRDNQPEPRLVFEWHGDSRVVRDSRSETELEHHLGTTGIRILDLLAVPHSLKRLKKNLADMAPVELEEQLAWLRSLGLVFQENDRYIGLVTESGREYGTL